MRFGNVKCDKKVSVTREINMLQPWSISAKGKKVDTHYGHLLQHEREECVKQENIYDMHK